MNHDRLGFSDIAGPEDYAVTPEMVKAIAELDALLKETPLPVTPEPAPDLIFGGPRP